MLARRSPHVVALLLAACCFGAPSLSHAQERESARHHLRLGVTLFQEQNFAGALAEFEASYRDLPSASALQNIALCNTRLFRYVEALEALEKLQRDFGDTLSAEDNAAVRKTMQELSPLVGSLTLRVDPPDAVVTIDRRPVDRARLERPIRLSSGEYRVAGTAPSRAPAELLVKIAGGEQKSVDLVLPADSAELSILASDPAAAIAIDRQPLAYGAWSGTIAPGSHLLQVYKAGHEPFSTQLAARAGEKLELRIPLGPPSAGSAAHGADGGPASPSALPYAENDPTQKLDEPPPKGFYGLVAATSTAVLASPDRFTPAKDADATGGFFGLRAGYRFNSYFAFEGLFESGGQDVDGTLLRDPANADSAAATSYELTTNRYGGNVRLLAGGRSLRFSGTFGVGAVHHKLLYDGATYSGTNSYFGFEVGPQANMGKAILELTLQTAFEGATGVRRNGGRIYSDHTILPQIGLGLRVGYGEWGRW